MQKVNSLLPYLLLIGITLFFGTKWIEINKESRFIEVTGSAELEVEADEIHFSIGIREYYNSTYQITSRSYYEPGVIGIDSIENTLFRQLEELGIH